MAVMGLGVRRAGHRELHGGKWVQSCVRERGREGCVTAPAAAVLLPSSPGQQGAKSQDEFSAQLESVLSQKQPKT